MQQNGSPAELLGLFHKIRQLADTHLATLSAWRDVETYCRDNNASLVPLDQLDEWFDVSTRAIQSIKFLATAATNPQGAVPEYWAKWQHNMLRAVGDHIADTLDILDNVPRF